MGRKTAAVVLLFAFGRPEIPVDTHVYRVGGRLGLFRPNASFEEAHDEMLAITPPEDAYELHINLIRHGRAICRPAPVLPRMRPAPHVPVLQERRSGRLYAPPPEMKRSTFVIFGLVVLLLGIGVPAWAITHEGTESASPEEVASNLQAGKELFVTNCGACHTLAKAGTDGVVGPNLDDLLAPPSASAPDPGDDQAPRPQRDRERGGGSDAEGRASAASRPTRSRPSSPRWPARALGQPLPTSPYARTTTEFAATFGTPATPHQIALLKRCREETRGAARRSRSLGKEFW